MDETVYVVMGETGPNVAFSESQRGRAVAWARGDASRVLALQLDPVPLSESDPEAWAVLMEQIGRETAAEIAQERTDDAG